MKSQSTINNRQGSVNKRQSNVNNDQGNINDAQTVLNEKTRFDLKFSNAWAIFISVIIASFMFGITYTSLITKLDNVIANQKELIAEFHAWRTQAETRLGTVESKQNQVITLIDQHLGVNIR